MSILFASALLSSGCNRSNNPSTVEANANEYIHRAENYQRQGQYRAAIIEIRNALKESPQNRIAITRLAAIYNELGQGKAATKLMSPLAADANRDEALVFAEAFFLQHKYQSALDYLATSSARLKLANDETANLLKARSQLRLGQFDTAQVILEQLSQSNIPASLEIARLLQKRGDTEGSNARIAELLIKYPENVQVLVEAAAQAEQQGQLGRAEDLLSKALFNLPETDILLPQKAEVLQRLVTTLTKLGRSNEALVYAKAIADANPDGAMLQDKFKQGLELFEAGKLDEAETILTEVYNESGNDSVGALLGIIRYAKNDLKGAANYLSNVDPEIASDSALTAFASTQLRLAQPDKLLALFDAPARARIKNPQLKALVGIALLQTGARAEGEQLIVAAQAEQPGNPAISVILARYYLATRQSNKAIATLEAGQQTQNDETITRLLIAAYASANKPDQALATARRLANSAPPKAENWWVLGHTALLLHKADIAEPALRSALKEQASFLPAQLDLAKLHFLRNQPEQAAAQYRTILAQHPENLNALNGLVAVIALSADNPADIDKQLLAIVDNTTARAALAGHHLRNRQLNEADTLLKAIPEDKSNAYAAQLKQELAGSRAELALRSRDIESARNYVVDGLQINPRNPRLLLLLARIEIAAHKPEEAKKVALQLEQLLPRHPIALELLGDVASLEKQSGTAADYYRKAWAKLHNNGIALKLYQSLSKTDGGAATRLLDEWQNLLPDSDTPWFLQGLERQNAGDKKAAISGYEAAIARNPNNPEALNNLAWLYGENGDPRALKIAEKAATISPHTPAVLDTYGWLLVQRGEKEKGVALLREAAKLAPGVAEIQAHLKAAEKDTN